MHRSHMRRQILALMFAGTLIGVSAIVGGPSSTATAASPPPETNSSPSATLTLTGDSVAMGVGYTWGDGTLDYQGAQRTFKVAGLSVVAVGATKMTATGKVYNLERIEDFNGIYSAVSAGATAVGGGSVMYLRNQNGVVIEITAETKGLDLQLAIDGVKFALN